MSYTYIKPQFGLVVFHVLSSHLWLVATVLECTVVKISFLSSNMMTSTRLTCTTSIDSASSETMSPNRFREFIRNGTVGIMSVHACTASPGHSSPQRLCRGGPRWVLVEEHQAQVNLNFYKGATGKLVQTLFLRKTEYLSSSENKPAEGNKI